MDLAKIVAAYAQSWHIDSRPWNRTVPSFSIETSSKGPEKQAATRLKSRNHSTFLVNPCDVDATLRSDVMIFCGLWYRQERLFPLQSDRPWWNTHVSQCYGVPYELLDRTDRLVLLRDNSCYYLPGL